jgi:geranylgeranyl pyrophosphate synthase
MRAGTLSQLPNGSEEKKIRWLKAKLKQRLLSVVRSGRSAEECAQQAIRYSVLNGGHRWRPILFLSLIAAMDMDPIVFLDAAAGLEVFHSATLIIDDLPFVDNADRRRRKSTCHVVFGADVALYASHLGFDLAERLIVQSTSLPERESVLDLLHRMKSRLVAGQCLERSMLNGATKPTEQKLTKQYDLKSGALFAFVCELAAVLGNRHSDPFRALGKDVGIAYQIADDLADIRGAPKVIGKAINMDLHKCNYVRSIGVGFARSRFLHHHRSSMAHLNEMVEKGLLSKHETLVSFVISKLHQNY